MSRDEAAAFLAANEGNACVRFFRRPDGTVITRDCQDAKPLWRGGLLRAALLGLVSWLGLAPLLGVNDAPERETQRERARERHTMGKLDIRERRVPEARQGEIKQDGARPDEQKADDGTR
jgi:hypothetical protein